jgi:hypothetical protein
LPKVLLCSCFHILIRSTIIIIRNADNTVSINFVTSNIFFDLLQAPEQIRLVYFAFWKACQYSSFYMLQLRGFDRIFFYFFTIFVEFWKISGTCMIIYKIFFSVKVWQENQGMQDYNL